MVTVWIILRKLDLLQGYKRSRLGNTHLVIKRMRMVGYLFVTMNYEMQITRIYMFLDLLLDLVNAHAIRVHLLLLGTAVG